MQLEGWLKGEFLYFLQGEKEFKRLLDFDREVRFDGSRRKIDIKLKIDRGNEIWIELKHWLIGYQKEAKYYPRSYFGDPTGIKVDAEKLNALSGETCVLVLATANPGTEPWYAGLEKFNLKFSPLKLKTLTDPKDFPAYYYLGLLTPD